MYTPFLQINFRSGELPSVCKYQNVIMKNLWSMDGRVFLDIYAAKLFHIRYSRYLFNKTYILHTCSVQVKSCLTPEWSPENMEVMRAMSRNTRPIGAYGIRYSRDMRSEKSRYALWKIEICALKNRDMRSEISRYALLKRNCVSYIQVPVDINIYKKFLKQCTMWWKNIIFQCKICYRIGVIYNGL